MIGILSILGLIVASILLSILTFFKLSFLDRNFGDKSERKTIKRVPGTRRPGQATAKKIEESYKRKRKTKKGIEQKGIAGIHRRS